MTGAPAPAVRLWNGLQAEYSLLAFDVNGFSPAAFDAERIACPPTIARSSLVRQATFFHGRLAARRALARFGHADTAVGVGPAREPCWPAGIVGSISHRHSTGQSIGHAVAIALPARGHGGIGIDIESVADGAGCAALAALCVHDAELARLRVMAAGMPLNVLLTLIFSAKESFYKAAFASVGRFFDFHAVTASAIDISGAYLHLRVVQALCPALPPGTRCTVHFRLCGPDTVFTSCSLPPGCHAMTNTGATDDGRIHPL